MCLLKFEMILIAYNHTLDKDASFFLFPISSSFL